MIEFHGSCKGLPPLQMTSPGREQQRQKWATFEKTHSLDATAARFADRRRNRRGSEVDKDLPSHTIGPSVFRGFGFGLLARGHGAHFLFLLISLLGHDLKFEGPIRWLT